MLLKHEIIVAEMCTYFERYKVPNSATSQALLQNYALQKKRPLKFGVVGVFGVLFSVSVVNVFSPPHQPTFSAIFKLGILCCEIVWSLG